MGYTEQRFFEPSIEVHDDWAPSATYVHAVTVPETDPDDWIDTIGISDLRPSSIPKPRHAGSHVGTP
jgi:hypothetical protein